MDAKETDLEVEVRTCVELLNSLRFAEAIAGGILPVAAPISIIADPCGSFQNSLQQTSFSSGRLFVSCCCS